MSRFSCVLGPQTDCEFREGIWCRRGRVEAVASSLDGTFMEVGPVCKMRTRQPSWFGPQCRCIPDLSPAAEAVLNEVYKKRGTEEEGTMLHCVLSGEERKDCVSYAGQDQRYRYGQCSLSAISYRLLKGIRVCDQYKEELRPLRCDVCGRDALEKIEGGWYIVDYNKVQSVLCAHCHPIYDSLSHDNYRSYGRDRAMDMIKALVARARGKV